MCTEQASRFGGNVQLRLAELRGSVSLASDARLSVPEVCRGVISCRESILSVCVKSVQPIPATFFKIGESW